MAAVVTVERIAALQADIAAAINQTSEHSPLPKQQQAAILAQCCAETCGLLSDWSAGRWWEWLRPFGDGPVSDYVVDQHEFQNVMGPMLKDFLDRASRHGMSVDPGYVDQAREAVAAAAKARPRKRQKLFQTAKDHVEALQKEVCTLAQDLRHPEPSPAKWRRARSLLTKVSATLLLPLILAMAGAGPSQAAHDLSDWGHEAVKVLALQHLADSAQPHLHVRSPHAGPRLS
jgi:hypothetical protein